MDTKLCAAFALGALAFPGAALAAKDRNHDGIPDRWERHYHLSLHVKQGKRDQDRDRVRNVDEWRDHTSPRDADSDNDGTRDGLEAPPTETQTEEAHPAITWDDIDSYVQSDGFGGPLILHLTDGSAVKAFFGEKAILRCGPAADGPFAPCDKRNLKHGVPVAAAAHGVNPYGYDVWTTIDLVTTPVSDDSPPQDEPAPEQQPAPPATGSVESYDTGGRVLVVQRPGNDEHPSGVVPDDLAITCILVRDGKVAGVKSCTTDDLAPGTQIARAQRSLVEGVLTWTRLDLLVEES
jgi:hypothetical protein